MKIIPEFPNYRIYEDGHIESNFKFKTNIPSNTWRRVKPVYDKSCGYMLVTLCSGNGIRKNKRLHRLLCEAFLANPDNKAHVNHIDGNKRNNTLSNLEWCTPKENARHAVELGLCDERRGKQEIGINQIDPVNGLVASFNSLHEAGRCTGIAYQNIHKVCNGQRKTAGGFIWEYS